jgi:hypothetical protein
MENLCLEPNRGWFGYLKTEENSNNRGTSLDQRIKDLNSLLFQDLYTIPSVKLYLNLVLTQDCQGGSVLFRSLFVSGRLNDYRRVGCRFSKVLIIATGNQSTNWFGNFKELSLGLEIFNLSIIKMRLPIHGLGCVLQKWICYSQIIWLQSF